MDRNTNKAFFDFLDESYREVREKVPAGEVLRINRALSNKVWDKILSEEITRANSDRSLNANTASDVLIAALTPAVKSAQRAYLAVNDELTNRFH